MNPKKKSKIKSGKRGQICDICLLTFSSAVNLAEHKKIHQLLKESNYACNICNEKFHKDNVHMYKKHMFMHDVKIYTCENCKTSFKYFYSYLRHIRDFDEPHYFPCDKCGKVFRRLVFLTKHYCKVRAEEEEEEAKVICVNERETILNECNKENSETEETKEWNALSSLAERNEDISAEWQCKECSWLFISEMDYKRHLKIYCKNHFSYPCCGETLKNRTNILGHICKKVTINEETAPFKYKAGNSDSEDISNDETEKNGLYKCENCPASFFNLESLRKHLKNNPGNHNFKCEKCEKQFTDSVSLEKHLCIFAKDTFMCSCKQSFNSMKTFRQHVGYQRPYICCLCRKKNETFTNLINHIRTHTKDRPFACEMCGKTFSVNGSLQLHIRIHNGERPFKCEKCDYSSATRWNLKVHERKHSPTKNEKRKFLCSECGVKFYSKQHVIRHAKVHQKAKEHECKLCCETFENDSYLKLHVKEHKNGLKCPECGKKMNKKVLYKHHVDTGHFSFVCDVCEKVFFNDLSFRKHVNSQHVKKYVNVK